MTRPSFFEGVLVAGVASLSASVLHAALGILTSGPMALRCVIAGIGLGYLLYLLSRTTERVGRVTTLVAWTLAAAAAWGLGLPILPYLYLHLGLIWLIRSLYFHASLLAGAADLGVTGLGLAAGLWAGVHTGSVLLSVWCLFLVQALFVAIPPHLPRPVSPPMGDRDADRFQRAHRLADSALKRLAAQR